MPSIRLLIADNHQPFRQILRRVCELEGGVEIVGEAENGREVIALTHRLQPDVILMDVEMSIMDSVEVISLITAQNPATRVIVLTTSSKDKYALQAIKAGAYGYLLKHAEESVLIDAIQAVHRGEAMIDSQVTAQVLDEFRRISK